MDLSLVPYIDSPATKSSSSGNYRECLRNHAASMGGQAFDGCGEFMPGDPHSPLTCAACGCHRNFHRRDLPSSLPSPAPVSFFPPPPPFPPPLSPARRSSETPPRIREEEGPLRKRYRTKFTAEQKEKMWIFAEKLGWRIQKHDEERLDHFCGEIGVKRHALKVWMHNHKNTLSSSSSSTTTTTTSSAIAAAAGHGGAAGAAAAPTPTTIRV